MSTTPILPRPISWPHGHRFALTMVDDTDAAHVDNVKPVYDLLARLGMRTTKLVWLFQGESSAAIHGSSCDDPAYLAWVLALQQQGFEIGLHNAAPVTSLRERTCQALERFRALFGPQAPIHCNHTGCLEGIYWGDARLSGWRRPLYNLLTRRRRQGLFRGHIAGDPLFWGDLCQAYVRYVRNFVFDELNTLAVCPEMPYHDPAKPYVNFWFASTESPTLRSFLRHFTVQNIDWLVAEGGLCIAYVHFAKGFAPNGRVEPEFRQRLEYIASQDGWFAQASEVLDYLRQNASCSERSIAPARLRHLELRWLLSKLTKGTT
jgi:hypothetical protein